METTVGKFEVRTTAMGTSAGRWSGKWSIYMVGMPEHDAIAEGETDVMSDAGAAVREALRLGAERAKELDETVGDATGYNDFD